MRRRVGGREEKDEEGEGRGKRKRNNNKNKNKNTNKNRLAVRMGWSLSKATSSLYGGSHQSQYNARAILSRTISIRA